MEVETRTPDEMLDGAMKRIISIAEAVIKTFPRLNYVPNQKYEFSHDKGAVYIYRTSFRKHKGIEFELGFFHLFVRESDLEPLIATKYSESPNLIVCKED